MSRARTAVLFLMINAGSLVAAAVARGDIPADYKGKPYKGTPAAIPGRIELANLDTGGFNVSYNADHNRMNSAGYQPISGNDYRPDENGFAEHLQDQHPEHGQMGHGRRRLPERE